MKITVFVILENCSINIGREKIKKFLEKEENKELKNTSLILRYIPTQRESLLDRIERVESDIREFILGKDVCALLTTDQEGVVLRILRMVRCGIIDPKNIRFFFIEKGLEPYLVTTNSDADLLEANRRFFSYRVEELFYELGENVGETINYGT